MDDSDLRLALALGLAALTGCTGPPPMCAPTADSEVRPDHAPATARCAPRDADEWGSAPVDGPQLLPAELRIDGTVAEAVVLVAPQDPDGPLPRRLTFLIGLTDGSTTIIGVEPLARWWFAQERERLVTGPGGEGALMRCAPLPGGGELRLLPTRPSADPPPAGELYGAPLWDALRRRDAAGDEVARYLLWDPQRDLEPGILCSERLVVFQSGERRLRCEGFRGRGWGHCPVGCLGNVVGAPWSCTGQGSDGLLFCEP